MLLRPIIHRQCVLCSSTAFTIPRCRYSQELENSYTEQQREKILEVMNNSDSNILTRYEITKARAKFIAQYKSSYGSLKSLRDIDMVHSFSDKYAKKLFDSILGGPTKEDETQKSLKIKGQVLHPVLSDSVRQSCRTVLTVYVSVNSVCWAAVNKADYEVLQWEYYPIDYPDGKRFQITDIMNIAWNITQALPPADLYVMKAEATSLRASGSDPNNPKVLGVNLQKAQIIAMVVALINARSNQLSITDQNETNKDEDTFQQKVYFLRPSLPYRLYGTIVGNEKVSTEQTVDMILQNIKGRTENNSHVYMSQDLINMFRAQHDLQRDMLGHCLLLALTFMDLCMYKRRESIEKLLARREK